MAVAHSSFDAQRTERRRKLWWYATIAGFIAILIWEAWWTIALYRSDLFWSKYTWNPRPFFGADFISQSDLAARLSARGGDPYASRGHLFHYPPLVVWSFRWTPFFTIPTALRIWTVVCALLTVAGTYAAIRVRRRLPIGQLPLTVAVAGVLFSFPVLFQLERSNFDLITLAAMLAAIPLFEKGTSKAEFFAGCLLAAGPWVKLYPGLMALGLLALRRWRALGGFAVAGIAIGLASPIGALHSFQTLQIAVERMKNVVLYPYFEWSHSLSVGYMMLLRLALDTPLWRLASWNLANGLAALTILAMSAWVCWRLYKLDAPQTLLYPLLLWLNAVGSCFGVIANDYSLVFMPLAIVAVYSFKDPWFVQTAMALCFLWLQPVGLHIPGIPLLVIKMLGLMALGVSLVERARQPARSPSAEPNTATPVPAL